MADTVQLVSPAGQIYDVDASEADAAARANGLRPATPEQVAAYDREKRSGGAADQVLTAVETGMATGAELASQVSRFAGEVDPMGNPVTTVAPVPAANIAPGAFTPAAIERRETNPLAAMAGAAAVELPTLLVPGVGELGWAARLGMGAARAAVSGSIAEAGQTVIEGDEFSPADAAFYGLVGESLGALAQGGIGRLLRTTGKEAPSALEVAAMKATKADAADALGELAESPLKAGKLADNATELTGQATDDLADHLTGIEQRLARAEDSAFSKTNVRRAISKNIEAQADAVLTQGVALEDVARQLTRDAIAPEHAGFAKAVQEGVDTLLSKRHGADTYLAARGLVRELTEQAPESLPQYARDAVAALDDTLADEGIWGPVGKSYGQSRAAREGRRAFADTMYDGVGADRARVARLFEPGADRASLGSYLDSAEAAAKLSGDKTLRGAIASARKAIAAGDDAIGSRLLRDTFAERATNFVTDQVVSKGAKYALGALGLTHGPVAGLAAAALGDAVGPAVGRAVRPVVGAAVDAAAPFVEELGQRFTAGGLRPVLQRLTQSAATQLQTAGRSLSNGALQASQATIAAIAAPTTSVGIARFIGHNDNLRSAFNEKRDVLQKLRSNPELLIGEMSESLAGLEVAAPALHAGLVAKTVQAVSYLRTKLPETVGVSLASPSGIPPSQLAIRQFALYYSGATDPSAVIADVKNNRVRQEQIEALRAVWPEVYAGLRQHVLDGMSTQRATPQQRMRMDLLFDFGESLDAALSWRLAIANDGTRAAQAQQQPAPRAPSARTTPSVYATQPAGMAALANPQTQQV